MDPLTIVLIFFGVILLIASWIQLLITAANEEFTWGICALFLPPLAYLYGITKWDLAGDSIKMAIFGWVLVGIGISTI